MNNESPLAALIYSIIYVNCAFPYVDYVNIFSRRMRRLANTTPGW
jgi:hypothetical protein